MVDTDKTLVASCEAIRAGAGQALEWVGEVRNNAERLDREGDDLVEKLRRTRNQCRRLAAAAERPLSVGVFGMSQAGKSYLISTLARAANGRLDTLMDGHRLSFIGHVNPPGGGKEATGLVTRFTLKAGSPPAGFPVELSLFSEADLAKILGNSFFNDFNRERVAFEVDADGIGELLDGLARQRQPQVTGPFDADDMVDLLDYFEKRFEKSMAPLRAHYWPRAVELAPHLRLPERARLLAVLWGGIREFTDAYVTMSQALAQLGHARTVYVPVEALVARSGSEWQWRPDSILNVDVLDRLGREGGEPLRALPSGDGGLLPEVGMARSVLAALTAEMRFALSERPEVELLEHVDLLDFPGYRGRLDLGGIDEVGKQVRRDDADPVAQLLLRGKVAYLFERYTDDQEMNLLLMCTRCDTQIEVTTLAPVLSTWVHSTQGETPALRAARRPGLVWVATQLDRRLEAKPGQSRSQQEQEWTNMVHITLRERFQQCDWLDDWAGGQPFDNVFLVRKPGHLQSVFKTDGDGRESGYVSAGEEQRLATQRGIFAANEAVARHVRDPGAAFDAVLRINDGGMSRLADYLRSVAVLATKWERIGEQMRKIHDEIAVHRLGPYFQSEGAGEVEKKKKLAEWLYEAVIAAPDGFGELLYSLHPPAEELRLLYLAARGDTGGERPDAPPPKVGLIRVPVKRGAEAMAGAPRTLGRAETYAREVVKAWLRQLRGLPDNSDLLAYLGLAQEALQILTDELVTGSDRYKLEERIGNALRPLEEMRGTTRAGIVDQQVLTARRVVSDLVNLLGLADKPLAERPGSEFDGRKLFEPPAAIARGCQPSLPAEETNYPGAFIMDWLAAFKRLAIDNAGHSAGREITPEQNLRLGQILQTMRGDGRAP